MNEQLKVELTAALQSFLRNRLSDETDLGAGDGEDMLSAVVQSAAGGIVEVVGHAPTDALALGLLRELV